MGYWELGLNKTEAKRRTERVQGRVALKVGVLWCMKNVIVIGTLCVCVRVCVHVYVCVYIGGGERLHG